ncbi:hypothetical protein [Pseudoalteromonas sp. T1lg76]|uniref:hypothetical protein n=1 Tax=Pseudoalteromonas sp. T1lg76 TaxID=2077103 RepID=UPI000CF649DD|nr:hypothetical protein [Pseudoalteromonas sp. T1lg76]
MKKLLLPLMFISFQSLATNTLDLTDPKNIEIADMYPSYELLRTVSFEATGKAALLGFKIDKTSDDWDAIFEARISANMDGEQKIYITLDLPCSDQEEILDPSTIKTNGQNVRYYRFCNGSHVYMTPISKAGDNFLVDEFKKKDFVKFEFSDITVLFDAAGFTKQWNNFGGDAL